MHQTKHWIETIKHDLLPHDFWDVLTYKKHFFVLYMDKKCPLHS